MAEAAVSRRGDLWRARPPPAALRRRARAGRLRAAAGRREGRSGLHRPAVQCADRRPCLRLGRIRHREFAMGVGRDERGGVHRLPDRDAWAPAASVCARRRHRLRLHGLAAHGRAARRRRARLQRAQEPLRLEQDQRRHGHLLPLQARAGLRLQGRRRRPTSTPSASATPGATAPTSGTIPASAAWARAAPRRSAMHPTVKPTALVADAIRDCSRRGDDRARSLRRLGHHPDRRRDHRPRRRG